VFANGLVAQRDVRGPRYKPHERAPFESRRSAPTVIAGATRYVKGRLPIAPALPEIVGINLPRPETAEPIHNLTTKPALLTDFSTKVS
jgi:hypothetical protein